MFLYLFRREGASPILIYNLSSIVFNEFMSLQIVSEKAFEDDSIKVLHWRMDIVKMLSLKFPIESDHKKDKKSCLRAR